jgi:hypothetical protein
MRLSRRPAPSTFLPGSRWFRRSAWRARAAGLLGVVVMALLLPSVHDAGAATTSRRPRVTTTTEPPAPSTTSRRRATTTSPAAATTTTVAARSTSRRTLFIPGAGRVLDLGPAEVAKLAAGGRVEADVRGAAGLAASGTGTVIVDVTAVSPSQSGRVVLTPVAPDYARSVVTAAVTFVAGSTTVSRVAVPVGRDGLVRIDTTPGPAGLTVAVVGWVVTAPASVNEPSGVPLETCRLLDTATGSGGVVGALIPGRAFDIPGTGVAKVPTVSSATPPAMVLFAIGLRDLQGAPELLVLPTGATTPELRVVGSPGPALGAVIAIPVGIDPRIAFYPSGSGQMQLTVDAVGWVDRNGVAKSGGPC